MYYNLNTKWSGILSVNTSARVFLNHCSDYDSVLDQKCLIKPIVILMNSATESDWTELSSLHSNKSLLPQLWDMRQNLFLEQLNSGGETAVSASGACLPSYHHIHTDTISWFSCFFLLSSSSDYSTVSSWRILLLYSSEPISFASPWEKLWDTLQPSTRRSWWGEKDPVGTFNKGWKCGWSCFLQLQFHVCINKVPTLTLALLKVSSSYKLPKPSLSSALNLMLSGFLALVLLFPLFLSNSAPPLFFGGLSLIHTGSRVIDVSADVRTAASITVGISSPVMSWWHRRSSCSCPFTASLGMTSVANRHASL